MDINKIIEREAEKYDSFYLYDENIIDEYTGRLKRNFPKVKFLYSVKCNSNPLVVKSVFSRGFGADAASLNEVLIAEENGLSKDEIYYSAPGKSEYDIREAVKKSTIIADSIGEIKKLQNIAEKMNIVLDIGVRINPEFSFDSFDGKPSKFGIDEEQLFEYIKNNELKNINIVGIHVHIKSQELKIENLISYYEKMFNLAERFRKILNTDLKFVNMGSGIGIQFSPKDKPLDIERLGEEFNRNLEIFLEEYPNTKVFIEVGRYATGKSGRYITKVMDKKTSYGKTYVILKNTLNGFLRPAVIKMVEKFTTEPDLICWEPLFTCSDAFEIRPLKDSSQLEKVTLVGNLCTATDVILEDVIMPKLECEDLVEITNAGAYAAVLSPMQFSSQEKPAELFLTVDGRILK
ncbi:diaminopimelate decarboxylase family protein [Peptoniphilus mikwangii]|uniref:diaminopimelate decarboxylase family protein n=1 Tax=Peptoniphilus mikwangii TaxID=1354300 RepID=UPI0003FFA788|nr:diaminopimelate decarboxylase [Peptoniphilus mikwangii]